MQLLSFFISIILFIILSFIDGSKGNSIHDASNGQLSNSIDAKQSSTKNMVHPSTNHTTFSAEAHLTFSNKCTSTILTQREEAFLGRTMILAFEHSKIAVSPSGDDGQYIQMIDAQILGKEPIDEKDGNSGKQIRRKIRYRPHWNRYYRIYDYSIMFDFGCGNLCGDKSGFWDRHRFAKIVNARPTDKFVVAYGRKICNDLRASTYEVFKTVSDCRIQFV
jgi:hypothetical protein